MLGTVFNAPLLIPSLLALDHCDKVGPYYPHFTEVDVKDTDTQIRDELQSIEGNNSLGRERRCGLRRVGSTRQNVTSSN